MAANIGAEESHRGCRGGRLTVTLPLPFKDSRRLTDANPYVPAAGVALDVIGIDLDGELFAAWSLRVERVRMGAMFEFLWRSVLGPRVV